MALRASESAKPGFSGPRLSQATWIALGILVLTFAAYVQVVGFKFVSFDDPTYITDNPIILGGLSWKSVRYAFTTGEDGSYLPLVWISHAASISLFGLWAGGHHLVNLLLHGANSVLLFLFLNRITKALWPSAIVAALFALHPLHVESVAWVTERKDVLSTLFWILTSWGYVHYVDRPSVGRYGAMSFLFILGLLSKSMLVTLPCTLLLFDIWPLRRIDLEGSWDAARFRDLGPLVLEKVPLLALSLGCSWLTVHFQKGAGAMVSKGTFPLAIRAQNAVVSVVEYLRQMFYPVHLSAFYPHEGIHLQAWKVAVSLGVIMAVSALCALTFRRRPYLIVGWLWYLITVAPVVGVIQVGSQAHADRYTYVPLIGVFLMLAWLGREWVAKWNPPRALKVTAAGMMLGTMFGLTAVQAAVWRDTTSLWEQAISIDPKNAMAFLYLGEEYMKEQRFQEAVLAFEKALEASPRLETVHQKMGLALDLMGRPSEALGHYLIARKEGQGVPIIVEQRLGSILTGLGRFEEAAPFVQKVIQQKTSTYENDPGPMDLQGTLIDWATILSSRNRLPEAIQTLEAVLKEDPESVRARVNLGLALTLVGNPGAALEQLEMASQLNPRDTQVLYFLGVLLTDLKQFEKARAAFLNLRSIDPRSPMAARGLAKLEMAERGIGSKNGPIHGKQSGSR